MVVVDTKNTRQIGESISSGGSIYYIVYMKDDEALKVEVESNVEPYSIDIQKSNIPPQDSSSVEVDNFVSALPLGSYQITDTERHTVATANIAKYMLVSITNDSQQTIRVSGQISTHDPRDSYSTTGFLQDTPSGVSGSPGLGFIDGKQIIDAVRSQVKIQNDVVEVLSVSDLPSPVDGEIHLSDDTAYWFRDFVTSPHTLVLGDPSPLLGNHGSLSGYIHTGGTTCVEGDTAPFFVQDMYLHSPNAQLLDLVGGDQNKEMLVIDSSFSDAAGLGNISDLGVIDGYRVPSFKGVNFEDFDAGLTLTGVCDKVFFSGCPMRSVDSSNVTILLFDENLETDIVDMTNNYIKSVQSDTKVVDVDGGAVINDIFQYRGTTHDSTVTESNILNGQAGVDVVGYRISDSYPLSNSKSFIDYTLDGDTTVTITTQADNKTDADAYVSIGGSTTEQASARFSHSNNLATYEGKRDRIANLNATLSLGTGTSDVIAAAWFENGSIVSGTPTRVQMNQQGGGIAKTLVSTGVEDSVETDDEYDVRLANLGSTSDIDVGEFTAKIST